LGRESIITALMTIDTYSENQTFLDRLIATLRRAPWPEALEELWKLARKATQDDASRGMYEVLEYE
jgi:hypothetical protein